MNFIKLDVQESQFDPNQFGKDSRSKLKEFSRLNEVINSSSVERWKTELTDIELAEFNCIAGIELENYGYSISDRPA
jgi:hypothetical protein